MTQIHTHTPRTAVGGKINRDKPNAQTSSWIPSELCKHFETKLNISAKMCENFVQGFI